MRKKLVGTLLLMAIGFHPFAFAEDASPYHPFIDDTFVIGVGYFAPDVDFKARAGGELLGRKIDFDETFDLDEDQTFNGDLLWRFGEKWSIGAQYWAPGASSQAVLEEDVSWNDWVFKEGTQARGGFDFDIARLLLGRSISSGPQHELGVGLGVHWLSLEAFIEGEVIVDDDSTGFRREDASTEHLFPNLSAWYMHSLSSRWLFSARVDWLSASIGKYSGHLWGGQAGVFFRAFENVNIGLHYKSMVLDLDIDSNSWLGSVEWDEHGPLLNLSVSW